MEKKPLGSLDVPAALYEFYERCVFLAWAMNTCGD